MTSTFVIDQSEKLLSSGALLYVGGVGGRGSEEITGGLEINSRVLCIYMGNSSVSGHSSVHGDFWERRCEELLVHQGAMTQDKSPAQLSSLCAHLAKRPVLIHSATHSCETAILFARWMTFFCQFWQQQSKVTVNKSGCVRGTSIGGLDWQGWTRDD